MTDTPQLLLAHHLKALKLPTFLREYDKLARQCATEGLDHIHFLLRLAELAKLVANTAHNNRAARLLSRFIMSSPLAIQAMHRRESLDASSRRRPNVATSCSWEFHFKLSWPVCIFIR